MTTECPHDDLDSLTDALASDIVAALEAAIEARGRASFVVTGGATPAPLYDILARRDARWRDVAITLSDERWVPVTDAASNEGMVRRTLLAGAPAAAALTPLKTSHASAVEAVETVEAAISELPRPFDICLLGLGEDGHFASLFPGEPMRQDVLVQAVHAPNASGATERLSLSMGAIRESRRIILLFTGAAKLSVYRAARDGLSETPLALLLGAAGERTSAYWCAESAA